MCKQIKTKGLVTSSFALQAAVGDHSGLQLSQLHLSLLEFHHLASLMQEPQGLPPLQRLCTGVQRGIEANHIEAHVLRRLSEAF